VEETGCDGVELNFGCPHGMSERGMGSAVGQVPDYVEMVTRWCKQHTRMPVLVKLTPNVTDILQPARAAKRGGADGVSLINTVRGMALHPRTGEPWLGGVTGGTSGPAVRAIALAQVHAVAQAIEIPIVGMGGVQSGRDALDLMRAGATLVAVGTESFRDPAAGHRVTSELSELVANTAV